MAAARQAKMVLKSGVRPYLNSETVGREIYQDPERKIIFEVHETIDQIISLASFIRLTHNYLRFVKKKWTYLGCHLSIVYFGVLYYTEQHTLWLHFEQYSEYSMCKKWVNRINAEKLHTKPDQNSAQTVWWQ